MSSNYTADNLLSFMAHDQPKAQGPCQGTRPWPLLRFTRVWDGLEKPTQGCALRAHPGHGSDGLEVEVDLVVGLADLD
eukprot:8949684-Heterocapsa_arctica.AAC.1